MIDRATIGKRVALISIGVSAILAVVKIVIGSLAHSTSVVADGVESAGDFVASGFVFIGFVIAAKSADEEHPYGYGRYETLTGLAVGLILMLGGVGICYRSISTIGVSHDIPAIYGIWPLLASMISKAILSTTKFRIGRRIGSSSLVADAWNDFVDILSAITAMAALALSVLNPSRFLVADHYGGFTVGLIVVFTGLRVAKDSTDRLADTMPSPDLVGEIRHVAEHYPGVRRVEKCYARNSGLQYYVDLHIEVDPKMSVLESHELATQVRFAIRKELDWVADVLVHVEPWRGI